MPLRSHMESNGFEHEKGMIAAVLEHNKGMTFDGNLPVVLYCGPDVRAGGSTYGNQEALEQKFLLVDDHDKARGESKTVERVIDICKKLGLAGVRYETINSLSGITIPASDDNLKVIAGLFMQITVADAMKIMSHVAPEAIGEVTAGGMVSALQNQGIGLNAQGTLFADAIAKARGRDGRGG